MGNAFRRRIAIYACIIAGIIGFAYAAWYRSESTYQQFTTGVADDAAYYIKPAINYVLGHGPSFDGVNLTDNYEPLWFGVLVGYYSLLQLDSLDLFDVWRLTLLLQATVFGLFIGFFSYGLFRFTKHEGITSLGILAVVLLLTPHIVNLLETPLELLIIALILIQLNRIFERPAYEDFRESLLLLGMSVGLLSLARIDGLLMLPALVLPLSVKFRRNLSRLAWFITPIILLLTGYCLTTYNPLSAALPLFNMTRLDTMRELMAQHDILDFIMIKLQFIAGPHELGTPLFRILIQLFACIPATILILRQISRRVLSNTQLIILGFSSFLTCKYLFYTTLYHGIRSAEPRYWIVDLSIWIIIASSIVVWALKKLDLHVDGRLAKHGVAACCIVGLALGVFMQKDLHDNLPQKPTSETSILLDLADFIRTNSFFANKRIGSFNAGILGYFGGRQLTDLSGLGNSSAYAEMVKKGQRDAFIGENFDVFVESRDTYDAYYRSLGFSPYNVRQYVQAPVPYNSRTNEDYRIYILPELRNAFEKSLVNSID